MIRIAVDKANFEPAALLGELEALGGGGVASFTGLVRGGDGLSAMRLEHYPAMTERALQRIAETAMARWELLGVVIFHRTGVLRPGERIVFTGSASPHRAAALEACAFLIDWLKTDAPFWKQELFGEGGARWVDARAADDSARNRWS